MKRVIYLILILSLIICGVAVARTPFTRVIYKPSAADECTGKILCENLEGTGYDEQQSGTWSESGTVDEDYTTTILRGSQSLSCYDGGTDAVATYDWAESYTTLSVFFRYQFSTSASNRYPMKATDDSNNTCLALRVDADGDSHEFTIYHGSVTDTTSSTYSSNTTYYVWIDWTKGTGSDGTVSLYVDIDETKPGSAVASTASGDGNYSAERILFRETTSLTRSIFDQILVDDTTIGNVDS